MTRLSNCSDALQRGGLLNVPESTVSKTWCNVETRLTSWLPCIVCGSAAAHHRHKLWAERMTLSTERSPKAKINHLFVVVATGRAGQAGRGQRFRPWVCLEMK